MRRMKLIGLIGSLLAAGLHAPAQTNTNLTATVIFNVKAWASATGQARSLLLTPVNNPVADANGNLFWGAPVVAYPTNPAPGVATLQLPPNEYTVTMSGAPGSFRFTVGPNLVGTTNYATALTTNVLTLSWAGWLATNVPVIVSGDSNIVVTPSGLTRTITAPGMATTGYVAQALAGLGSTGSNAAYATVAGTASNLVSGAMIESPVLRYDQSGYAYIGPNYGTNVHIVAGQGEVIVDSGYGLRVASGPLVAGNASLTGSFNGIFSGTINASNGLPLAVGAGLAATTNDGQMTLEVSGVSSNLFDVGTAAQLALAKKNPVIYLDPPSSSAAIQAALDQGGTVVLVPGIYPNISNLYLTNGNALYGYGATLQASNNLVGYLLSASVGNTNVLGVYGLTLDGGATATNWAGNAAGVTTPLQYPNMLLLGNVWWVNRSGLFVDVAGCRTIRDVTCQGFPGYGVFMENSTMSDFSQPLTSIDNVRCQYNYIGLWLEGWHYDEYPNESGTDHNAEYMTVMHSRFYKNTFGLGIGVGNHNVHANQIVGNWCGAFFSAADNGGHAVFSENTVNHSTAYAIYGYNMANGELIQGNNFQAGVEGLFFDSCGKLQICGNHFQTQTITFADLTVPAGRGLVNRFHDNAYEGRWGVDFKVVTSGSSSATTNLIWGNYSLTQNNSDGAEFINSIANNNGSGTNTTLIDPTVIMQNGWSNSFNASKTHTTFFDGVPLWLGHTNGDVDLNGNLNVLGEVQVADATWSIGADGTVAFPAFTADPLPSPAFTFYGPVYSGGTNPPLIYADGTINGAKVKGNGSDLTNLNAANLTGTVPLAQLHSSVVTNNNSGTIRAAGFGSTGATGWTLQSDSGRVADNPVPTFRAFQTNVATVVDIMPHGIGPFTASWLDLVNRDLFGVTDASKDDWICGYIAVYTNGQVYMGSRAYGTSNNLQLTITGNPIVLCQATQGLSYVVGRLTLGSTNYSNGDWKPQTDNVDVLGDAAHRYKSGAFGTGGITSSGDITLNTSANSANLLAGTGSQITLYGNATLPGRIEFNRYSVGTRWVITENGDLVGGSDGNYDIGTSTGYGMVRPRNAYLSGAVIMTTNTSVKAGISGMVVPSFVGGTNYWVHDIGGGLWKTNIVGGGITTNVNVLVAGGDTNQLQFVGGILTGVIKVGP